MDRPAGTGFVNKLAQIGGTGTGSFNNNTGVIGVNQSSGNMANQANIVSLAGCCWHGAGWPVSGRRHDYEKHPKIRRCVVSGACGWNVLPLRPVLRR